MIEGAAGFAVRGHVAVVIGLIGVVCCSSSSPYSCLSHPSSLHLFDQTFSFTGQFVQSCHTFHKKKREEHSAEMQKNTKIQQC